MCQLLVCVHQKIRSIKNNNRDKAFKIKKKSCFVLPKKRNKDDSVVPHDSELSLSRLAEK